MRLRLPHYLLGLILLSTPGLGHGGGVYRGPGDVVPPGLVSGSPGRAPAGPSAPGPAGPGAPATPRPSAFSSPDLTVWDFWWGFNRDQYLCRTDAMRRPLVWGEVPPSGADRPTAADRAEVRRGLLEVVHAAPSPEPQILAACLIALAKLGDDPERADAGASLFDVLLQHLASGEVVVAEASVMAMGILADERAVPVLIGLIREEEPAMELLQDAGIPFRLRSFAAYSLGSIGLRAFDDQLRRVIGEALVDVLELESTGKDLAIACVQAFGLCAVQADASLDDPAGIPGNGRHVLDRAAQVRYLIDYVDPGTRRPFLVAAHAPTAIARLLDAGGAAAESSRVAAAEALLSLLSPATGARREVQWSALQALGRIGTASTSGGPGGLDSRIRRRLIQAVTAGDPIGRRFALMALARSGGTPGCEEPARGGTEVVSSFLGQQLAQGKARLQPWAGLAIGVFHARLAEQGLGCDAALILALREAAAACKSPFDVGAYTLGLGLSRDVASKEVLLAKLQHFASASDARGYCALALSLLGERDVIPRIEETIGQDPGVHEYLRQAAPALALLRSEVGPLLGLLVDGQSPRAQACAASALGLAGDRQAIGPLLRLVGEPTLPARTRAYAVAALGNLCARSPQSWSAAYAVGLNYRAIPTTMTDPRSHGLLDIL